MALLNIGASNQDDAFYRYKMPKLVTKVEGRGNGVKTNLVNMVDVAKALDRPPAYTTKYFGCELGAQSKFDAKTGTAIVNGSHDFSKLAGLLENFIKKYVQCYECGNPETEIVITKTQLITLKCAACGFVSDVSMRDKLTTFILKNPPEQKKKNEKKGMRKAEKERLKEGEALDKEAKHVKKDAKKKNKGHDDVGNGNKRKGSSSDGDEHSSTSSQADDSQDGSAEGGDDIHWQTDTSAKAAQQRIKEQLTAATSEMVILDTVIDDQEGAIGYASALAKPAAEDLRAGIENVTDPKHALFLKLVKEFKLCLEKGHNASEMASHMQAVQSQSTEQVVMNAFFEALFHGIRKGLAKDVGGKKAYLSKLVPNKHSQKLLLGAIEAFCAARPLELRKEVSLVLKLLYDLDILEEEVILMWYEEDCRGPFECKDGEVKKFAKPFVEWLQNAESEED